MRVLLDYANFKVKAPAGVDVFYTLSGGFVARYSSATSQNTYEHQATTTPATWATDFPLAIQAVMLLEA